MKRISRGFDRDFIWHRSCLQINPATKLWFPFIPKVPFPWLQCRGISSRGGWSEAKREKRESRDVLFFDLIKCFNLGRRVKKAAESNLNKEQITFFFFFLQRFYCLMQTGDWQTRGGLTKRFSGWPVIKLQVKTF